MRCSTFELRGAIVVDIVLVCAEQVEPNEGRRRGMILKSLTTKF